MEILALLLILAAIACFVVETVRTQFGMLPFGLALLAGYFLVITIPTLSS